MVGVAPRDTFTNIIVSQPPAYPMPRIVALVLLAVFAFAPAATKAAPSLEAQRQAFRQALPQAQAGRWEAVGPYLETLEGYPLMPDLRAAWLAATLGPATDDEVAAMLERDGDLAFSTSLRYAWAISLARRGEWERYLDVYEASYAIRGDTVLHCHALTARIRLGRTADLEADALKFWLSPHSQPAECDPAFDWLAERGAITPERRRARIDLALADGEFRLARWLARPLGEKAVAEVRRWERMRANPAARLAEPEDFADTPGDRALVLYGFRVLAGSDPEAAASLWPERARGLSFTPEERGAISRRIAMIHAWRHLPDARSLLDHLPPEAVDESVREWRVRVLLREQDWPAALAAVEALDPDTASKPGWRYWHARLLEMSGASSEARPIFAQLGSERGYYSFLSADRLGADYNWDNEPTPANEDVIAVLDRRADLVRARELYYTGLESRGRVEWARAMGRLSAEERAQASLLASRWGWHSQAIATASTSGLYDDLDLRFPMPWRPVFESRSRAAGIPSAWAYGIARSESLFMPDVRSRAGAIGLMQLMPATGRRTAPEAGIRYRGSTTLTDPESNISLGTTYLSRMLERFGDHRVLATAAYNAGPRRVDRWLPETTPLPADVWLETVPYSETRSYVQRVLASDAVFQWRMSGETVRLARFMRPVPVREAR